MSAMQNLKENWHYETNVPRCGICKHMRESRIVLTTDSRTKRINHHCALAGFAIGANACCDKWEGKDGSTVEAPPPAPSIPKTQKVVTPDGTAFICLNCGKPFATKQAADTHRKAAHPPPFKKAQKGHTQAAPSGDRNGE